MLMVTENGVKWWKWRDDKKNVPRWYVYSVEKMAIIIPARLIE
jgi:hypothetical protein